MGIHVLILAEAELGGLGGGESVIHGLVRGLAAVDRGQDRVALLCTPSLAEHLEPALAEGMRVICRPSSKATLRQRIRASLGPLARPLGRLYRRFQRLGSPGLPTDVPVLDPFIQNIQADVIHFMVPYYATGSRTPTVFTVHDLQHEHLPEFFEDSMTRYRRMLYNAVAAECSAIVAISRFTAQDFQKHHPCPESKLSVIPWAAYVAPDEKMPSLTGAEQHLLESLPSEFILYPAFSYAHKNHRRLLEALSLLERREGLRIPLVCTGGRSEEWRKILRHWAALAPVPALHDLGYVSRALLRALYQTARFVVFPTLFEGAGLPLLEAARLRVPIACSEIPPFREFAGNGPAYFDPGSLASMSQVLGDFWRDEDARRVAVNRTSSECADLSWERCAQAYLDLYRAVVSKV